MRAVPIVKFVPMAAAIFVAIAIQGLAQAQQKFPSKPIRLVTGGVAGSQTDTITRMIGQKMSERWGQPVVVENRPGAGGLLTANVVAKATPDGYTLWLTLSFSILSVLQPNLPFDPLKDFVGVAQIGHVTQVLFVAPALGVKSVKDLIALAHAQPGKLIYSTGGAGTVSHLNGARFRLAADINARNVAFKAGVDAVIETLAGRTQYGFASLAPALPFIKDGKLLALAVTTPQRATVLPDVPAMAETLAEFKRPESSAGLLAPAQTPRAIRDQISKEVARIVELPDIKERLQAFGFASAPSTPEAYDEILRAQIATLSRVVRDAGLRAK